jgi:DNA polymerase-3 subunit alpha
VIESLIKCGAFDSTGAKRSQMMEVIDEAIEIGQRVQRDRRNGQFSLFQVGADQPDGGVYPPLPEIKEWSESELLSCEKESLGFFISGHPLARHEPILKKFANTDSLELQNLADGSVVRIGGVVRDYKHYNDRKGALMAFVTLEDLSGFVEVTLFASVYSAVSGLIEKDAAVLVEGRVTKDERSVKILGDSVIPIERAEEIWTTSVHLKLDVTRVDKESLKQLHDILCQHKGSATGYLHLLMPQRTETIIALPEQIRLKAGQELTKAVNDFLGYGAVETICQRH